MMADIFSSKEIVRIFDFLLDDPLSQYTKSEIANGATISRPTLYKLVPELIRIGVLRRARKFGITELFELNVSSPLVVSLMKFDSELSKVFVNSNIEELYSNASGDDTPQIIYWTKKNNYWDPVDVAQIQPTNSENEENVEESTVIRNPVPSSA